MRVIRMSMFIPLEGGVTEPASVILRDVDLTTTIEDMQSRLYERNKQGEFFITEIFEMEDGASIEEATMAAAARVDYEREVNRALTWWWGSTSCRLLKPDGVAMAPDPAPLNTDELVHALGQLADHPEYKEGMTVVIASETGEWVKLHHGEVTVDDTP